MSFYVESPTVVSGPVVGSRPPWGAPGADLAALGYVVEEYQLEGTTAAFTHAPGTTPAANGKWVAEQYGQAPYRTRLLVVRPDASRFNGTVLLNWQNVSAGQEMGGPRGEVFNGFAWVGVSAQEVGIYGPVFGTGRGRDGTAPLGLVDADPERYGGLLHPGDPGSFTIFAQAARAVGPSRNTDVDPMGGLDVRRVVAVGASQSAMRLVAYANGVHLLDPVVDAFFLSVWEGRAPCLDEGPVGLGVRTTVRSDLDTPVMIVNSEFEARSIAEIGVVDSPSVRVWEVAGAPHAVAGPSRHGADGQWQANPLSLAPVYDAALRHMQAWVRDGSTPPSQPRLELEADSPVRLRRDAFGNAVGGIRLPELEAPTHEYRGMAFGAGRAPLFGAARPLPAEQLRALYPSAAAYVERWCAAVDAVVASGALRIEDAEPTRARAAAQVAQLGLG